MFLTLIRRCGPKHKRKATVGVCEYRFLQVECFKRNVAARAIEADIFEISVCEPVIGYSMAAPILQHQQEESLPHRVGRRIVVRRWRYVRIQRTCRR